jgi:hypothetical protein
MNTNTHILYLAQFSLEWEPFQTKVVEKIKTHILRPTAVFRKSRRTWDNVEKYGRSRQAKDGETAHAQCMPDN